MTDVVLQPMTFEGFDRLARKEFALRLERHFQIERIFIDGGLVVSLNAEFGTGKTAFLRMWESDLLTRREKDEQLPVPIFLNAWEDDYCGDPMIAIISGLVAALEANKLTGQDEERQKSLKDEVEHLGRTLYLLGGQLVTNHTGLNLHAAADQAKADMHGEPPEPPPSFVEIFRARKAALRELKDALNECFPAEENAKAIVFVDELDRCRPNYAVEYIETIKHVFDVRGLTFVLAVDIGQLRASVGALFGNSIDFSGYFRKFVHRQVGFPAISEAQSSAIFEDYVSRLVEHTARNSMLRRNFDSKFVQCCSALARNWRLTLRDLQEALRILGQVLSARENGVQVEYGRARALFLMAVCSVKDRVLFEKIGTGRITWKATLDELKNRLDELEPDERIDWQILCIAGFGRTYPSVEEVLGKLAEIHLVNSASSQDMSKFKRRIDDALVSWGSGFQMPGIQDCYKRIESILDIEQR